MQEEEINAKNAKFSRRIAKAFKHYFAVLSELCV
jgi:hypothetical protein